MPHWRGACRRLHEVGRNSESTIRMSERDAEANRFSARAARYARVGANVGGVAARIAGARLFGVEGRDATNAEALAKAAEDKRAELGKLDGAAFDKAYVDNEVAYHQQVNGALETLLIPSAQNAELKGLLETGLKLFQGHQQHAEHVAAGLK